MAANREGVGNIKPVRALCPFYCVCNTCIHIYIYIAHGSGAHSRSLAWSSGGLRGTDVPLPGRLPGPALVGPLQGPLRVLGPPEVINVLSSRKFPEEFPKTSAAVGSWMVDDHD